MKRTLLTLATALLTGALTGGSLIAATPVAEAAATDSLWVWSPYGPLGDGTAIDRASYAPVKVKGLTDVKMVVGSHALKNDGTVWGWGNNELGNVGDGTTTDRKAPVQLKTLTGVVSITDQFAVKSDHTLWGWGNNWDGRLGDGTLTHRPTPKKLLSGVTSVFTVDWSDVECSTEVFVTKTDGTLWNWGGHVCNDYDPTPATPKKVSGPTNIIQIEGNTALSSDGSVWDLKDKPKKISSLSNVVKLAGGVTGTKFALKGDGTVWGWGDNNAGQLGDGTTTDRTTPVQAKNLTGIVDVDTAGWASFAVQSTGAVWVWGYDDFGLLADATTKDRVSTPTKLKSLTGVKEISVTDTAAFALKTDGTVWAWGEIAYLGTGSSALTGTDTPKKVCGLTKITSVSAGAANYAIGEGQPCLVAATPSAIVSRTWTGKQIKPKVTLTYSTTPLKEGVDYTVSYGTNTALGKGTIKFTGKGSYLGTKTVAFKIVPKTTKITKATAGKKKVTLTWAKSVAAQKASGYQLQLRVKGTKTWKSTTNYKVTTLGTVKKNLKAGKAYEFRIRTYKKIGTATYYSAWSPVKTSGKVKK